MLEDLPVVGKTLKTDGAETWRKGHRLDSVPQKKGPVAGFCGDLQILLRDGIYRPAEELST